MQMRPVGFVPASAAASRRGQGATCLLCNVSPLSIALRLGSGTELVAPACPPPQVGAGWLNICSAPATEGRSVQG